MVHSKNLIRPPPTIRPRNPPGEKFVQNIHSSLTRASFNDIKGPPRTERVANAITTARNGLPAPKTPYFTLIDGE